MTEDQFGTGKQSDQSIIFTPAGTFTVQGSCHDTLRRLAADEWPTFTLHPGEEQVFVRSSDVVAIQSAKGPRGGMGFTR